MGRLGPLFLALLMAGGVLEAEAQDISFQYAIDYFNVQEETIQQKIQAFKESLGDKFNNLDDKIKSYIENQDFSSATAQELLAGLDKQDWEKVDPTMLRRMSGGDIQKLAESGGLKLPARLLRELDRITIFKMNDEEVAKIVKEKMPELTEADMSALLIRLGPVSSWSSDNITSFDVAALQLPVCLDDSNDKEVLQDVLDLINKCETTSPGRCPRKSSLPEIRGPVTMKLLGSPENWKANELTDLRLSEIPPYMIHRVSDDFVREIKDKLIEEDLTSSKYQEEAEEWIKAICKVDGCQDMSASNTQTWRRKLSKMQGVLTPSDISPAARKDAVLMDELQGNAVDKNTMRAVDAAILLDMKLGKETPDTIRQIGGKLAAWAPACYLAEAADNKELSAVRNELASVLRLVRGPEYQAKVRAAMMAEMEAATSSQNIFSISSVNDYMKAFIKPNLLRDQSSVSLLNVAKKADDNYINLTPHQMQTIISKLPAADSQKCPRSLCESLPISFMESFTTDYLAQIDATLYGVTLPCLLGVRKKFSDKTTLTASDIQDGKEFLKCMSFKDASKVKASDIFPIFEKITNEDLSWPACRAFKMKLMEWAEIKLDDEVQDDVLKSLYIDEIFSIPPCVIILSEPIIYQLDMEKKKAVLSNLCQAKNYFTIPKVARSKVVNTLLSQIMPTRITVCSLEWMNACFFDLNPSMLRKMDETAAMGYITLLERSLREGVPDCLDSARMDEVAEMVLRTKGPPKTWKTADDVSCILDTLSSNGINRIAAELPVEVLVTSGCPMRTDTFMTMPKQCKEASEQAMMRMRKRKVEKCVNLRKNFGTGKLTCDSMRCGNTVHMTRSQLVDMKKEDVMKYLDDLVTEDLDRGKAEVILAKVKETKALDDMSAEELASLKNAWRGLTKPDVSKLPKLTSPEYEEVVYQLGMTKMLPDDVMVAVKNKVLSDFKKPSDLNEMDVFLMGCIMCYFTKNEIGEVPTSAIKKSMRILGMLDCKNTDAMYDLATAAKEAYGRVVDWDAAEVHEMNLLVGGLKPEDYTALSDDAYIGLTPEGIRRIDPDTIKVMTVAQAKNLDVKTAASVTSAQMNVFPSEVQNAIGNAKSEELPSGASGLSVPGVTSAVVAPVLLLHLLSVARNTDISIDLATLAI